MRLTPTKKTMQMRAHEDGRFSFTYRDIFGGHWVSQRYPSIFVCIEKARKSVTNDSLVQMAITNLGETVGPID